MHVGHGFCWVLFITTKLVHSLFMRGCRSKYDQIIANLRVKPLKIQAGRGVMVKVTEEGTKSQVLSAGGTEEI